MQVFQRILLFLLGGATLGNIVTSLVVPRYLEWDNTPAHGQALCQCAELVRNVSAQLIRAQLIGSAIGAAVFLGIFIALSLRGKNQPPAPAPATPKDGPSL